MELHQVDVTHNSVEQPYFSICIPQYNRTRFLIEACRSLVAQSFRSFEVCISDDCSNDGLEKELLRFLSESGLSFLYRRQSHNSRYDGNLRASIAMSRGRYCLLLGNDDCLDSSDTLVDLQTEIEKAGPVAVVIPNYRDYATGRLLRRIHGTGLLGAGPTVAISNYRNLSFVSGLILDGEQARALATDRWDGSEMYQMFIGCRMIAAGGSLLGIEQAAVRKDIRIANEVVDSYARQVRLIPCPIIERRHTFDRLGRLVIDAVEPFVPQAQQPSMAERVLRQLLMFTYPFWIFEFRRVQSWNYAAGICLGMRPKYFMQGLAMGWYRELRLRILYLVVSGLGLLVPLWLFDRAFPKLYAFAKSKAAADFT